MTEDTCPVRWINRQAVMTLPEHIDRSNADRIRDQLLLVINRGAVALIADLAATLSCDYSDHTRAMPRPVANIVRLRLCDAPHGASDHWSHSATASASASAS